MYFFHRSCAYPGGGYGNEDHGDDGNSANDGPSDSAQEVGTISDALENPAIIAAMKNAWKESRNGGIGIEATFRLDGNWSDYTITAAPITHEFMKQKVPIIRGETFAVFHVHPNSCSGSPSATDKYLADKHKINIYTMHTSGLYEYDSATGRTTMLRLRLNWLKPAESRKNLSNGPMKNSS